MLSNLLFIIFFLILFSTWDKISSVCVLGNIKLKEFKTVPVYSSFLVLTIESYLTVGVNTTLSKVMHFPKGIAVL